MWQGRLQQQSIHYRNNQLRLKKVTNFNKYHYIKYYVSLCFCRESLSMLSVKNDKLSDKQTIDFIWILRSWPVNHIDWQVSLTPLTCSILPTPSSMLFGMLRRPPDTRATPSAKLSGIAFTKLPTFFTDALNGLTIYWNIEHWHILIKILQVEE